MLHQTIRIASGTTVRERGTSEVLLKAVEDNAQAYSQKVKNNNNKMNTCTTKFLGAKRNKTRRT